MQKASIHSLYRAAPNPPKVTVTLYTSLVAAGFPSPADDHIDGGIDLNELIIKNKPATFFARVSGNSLSGIGILPGDVLTVDCSISPKNGKIVVAAVDGEFTVKRFARKGNTVVLSAEHPDYPPIVISDDQELAIIGVVTALIRDQL